MPLPKTVSESTNTYTFDRNVQGLPSCRAVDVQQKDAESSAEDALAQEWSRVRGRLQLSNCVDTGRKNSCGDF